MWPIYRNKLFLFQRKLSEGAQMLDLANEEKLLLYVQKQKEPCSDRGQNDDNRLLSREYQ